MAPSFHHATINRRAVEIHWNPYVAGVALGLVLFAAFFITGSGLGGSVGFARLAAFIQATVVPGSADTSAYLAPMVGGGRNPLDNNMVWMTYPLSRLWN